MRANSIVIGGSGFIGRALVAQLLGHGRVVVAAVRGAPDRLTDWLDTNGVERDRLTVFHCDITVPGIELDGHAKELLGVRDVYNAAALMAFGLPKAQARLVNVTGAINVLDWAATLPSLRRIIHITGYRHTAPGAEAPTYADGAYAASKVEGDTALRRRAAERGLPLTIANPSTVIGEGQYFGLADMLAELWRGSLPAIPGRDTFVPVVELKYFAAFLAAIPERPETAGQELTVLDPQTPILSQLVQLVAEHMGVQAPRRTVPLALLRRLPRALTGADPESLGFLGNERYDTSKADALAAAVGLRMPPVGEALWEWTEHLVATRFGVAPHGRPGTFRNGTWLSGERQAPRYVLLHGLPTDGEAWSALRDCLPETSLTADLPGLGRSAPSSNTLDEWLTTLLESVTGRPVLVAHSLACGPAICTSAKRPDLLSGLVLVAPAFLQQRPSRLVRSRLATLALRHVSASRLARLLNVPEGPAIASAQANLRRSGVAARTTAALRASTPKARKVLSDQLARLTVPVQIVLGSTDPLLADPGRPVTVIPGAGHYPHLTHPEHVAQAIASSSWLMHSESAE